jgi:glycosyltransferase involved in cell wall biosynthesis
MLAPQRYRAVSIAQSVWLWDLWPGLPGLRATFFRRLLRHHEVEVVLSRVNRDASLKEAPERTVVRVPFGTHFATPAAENAIAAAPPRVLVVGNDRHRDWGLLAEVTALVPEADFDIISLSEDARSRSWPANVEIRSALQSQVLAAYAASSLVALPLRENRHASGCTVAIEAISAGIPLIVSDAGGIDEYVSGADAELVPIGDPVAFAAALRSRLIAPQGDRVAPTTAADRGLSERDYIARLALLTHAALSGTAIDPAVTAFDRVPETILPRQGVLA